MFKNAFWLFFIAIIVFFVFLPSYAKMQDLRKKNQDYDQQLSALQQKNRDLKEEHRLLREDPVYLEKVAREKMGLIRENEVVYKITPASARP